MRSGIAHFGEAILSPIARRLSFGTTVVSPGGRIVGARLKGDALVDLLSHYVVDVR